MINIKLEPNNITPKIALYLLILITIFISSSKIVFSEGLNQNINYIISSEERLAIKYCDATNKDIFDGLNKENLLKYEYYFSTLNIPKNKDPEKFFKEFILNIKKNCSLILNEREQMEFKSYIKKFLE
tara:strand:+ start:217 stop:600 length:384 start_codon:yes stop_codon:yes gene_type:complete